MEYRPWSCFFFWVSSPADRELFPAGLRMELGFLNSFDRTLVSLSLQKPSSLRVVCIFYVKAGCLGRDGLGFFIVIVIVSLHHRPALFLSAAATSRYASLLPLAASDIALKASTPSIPSHCNNHCAATTTATTTAPTGEKCSDGRDQCPRTEVAKDFSHRRYPQYTRGTPGVAKKVLLLHHTLAPPSPPALPPPPHYNDHHNDHHAHRPLAPFPGRMACNLVARNKTT